MTLSVPKISVVIPTYNRAGLIAEAIKSVIAQTWRNWEIIVVDNGSTDGTKAVVDGFQNAWIKYIYLERGKSSNPGQTRNYGLDEAGGDFIAFLDSDDTWAPEKLEVQLKAFTDDAAVQVSVTNFRFIDLSGKVTQDGVIPSGYSYRGDFIRDYLDGKLPIYTSTVLVRRAAMADIRFSPKYIIAEDMDVWLKLAGKFKVAYEPQPLTSIRKHSDNISAGRADTLLAAGPVLEENKEVLKAKGLDFRKYVARFYVLSANAAIQTGQREKAWGTLRKAAAAYPWDLNIYKGLIKCTVGL